jgi:hypothetical protein
VKPAFILQAGGNKKLLPRFGPFQITRKVGVITDELGLPLNPIVHPVINNEYLKGYNQNPDRFGPRDALRHIGPDSVALEPSIEEIRVHRLSRGETQLLVHANAATHDDTWIEALSIKSQAMVDEYMLRNKDGPCPAPVRQDQLAAQAMARIHDTREREARPRKSGGDSARRWNLSLGPRSRSVDFDSDGAKLKSQSAQSGLFFCWTAETQFYHRLLLFPLSP